MEEGDGHQSSHIPLSKAGFKSYDSNLNSTLKI
jgi:hypothetical protein